MGYSQDEIRQLLNLDSTSMISRWERGLSMPSGRNLLKLSIIYKTLVNELYRTLSAELRTGLLPENPPSNVRPKAAVPTNPDRGP